MSAIHSQRTHDFTILTVFAVLACLPFLLVIKISAQPNTAPAAAVNLPASSAQIPNGTVLPIRLNRGFSAKSAHTGETITGRLMQAVPLPNGGTIPEGATVSGKILFVAPASNGAGETVSFAFNQLAFDHQKLTIAVDLRALASAMTVELAQVPDQTYGFGTPPSWADSTQIGGDSVYGAGGEVTDSENHPVGKALYNGVLVHVRAQPGGACRGPLDGDDRLQALWLFSSDACGVYGMQGVSIAHAGRTDPLGIVVLAAPTGKLKLRAGSGMLLRVLH
jgi:hypothetical protein